MKSAAAVCLTFLAMPGLVTAEISVAASGSSLIASGLTPGGNAYWCGFYEYQSGFTTYSGRVSELVTVAGDGRATITLANEAAVQGSRGMVEGITTGEASGWPVDVVPLPADMMLHDAEGRIVKLRLPAWTGPPEHRPYTCSWSVQMESGA